MDSEVCASHAETSSGGSAAQVEAAKVGQSPRKLRMVGFCMALLAGVLFGCTFDSATNLMQNGLLGGGHSTNSLGLRLQPLLRHPMDGCEVICDLPHGARRAQLHSEEYRLTLHGTWGHVGHRAGGVVPRERRALHCRGLPDRQLSAGHRGLGLGCLLLRGVA